MARRYDGRGYTTEYRLKFNGDSFAANLEREWHRAYLVSGDEPLLMQEAGDAIRRAARERGYTDRTVFNVARGFDWGQLTAAGASLSLFAERRIIEVRHTSNKLAKAAEQALTAFLAEDADDTLLLMTVPRLDRKAAKASWVQAFDRAGVHVEVRGPDVSRLPDWIAARLRSRGFEPSAEATRLLADRVEGNLLAAAQEVEKLALLRDPGPVDELAIREAVADSARYDVFSLADAALAASPARVMRVLGGLRAEGVDPTLVLWAVTRELRTLAAVAWATATGKSERDALRGVWQNRQSLVIKAARRLTLPGIHALLRQAGEADQAIKGLRPGVAPWPLVTTLVAAVAGVSA